MDDLRSMVDKFSKTYKRDVTKVGGDPGRIPSGLFAFDLAVGGGWPEGRISILYGPESSGKSLMAMLSVAEAQKKYPDLTPVYADVEGTFTPEWAAVLGVDLDNLVTLVPDSAEELIDMAEQMLSATDISLFVVDSLAAMMSHREINMDADKDVVGGNALAVGKLYRRSARVLNTARSNGSKATVLWINQIRHKIGVMYGNPETTPGGNAARFGSSLTVRVYGKDVMDKDISKELPAFKEIKAVVKKNKVPIANKNAEFDVALLPNDKENLRIGQAQDRKTLLVNLKAHGPVFGHRRGVRTDSAGHGGGRDFPGAKGIPEETDRGQGFRPQGQGAGGGCRDGRRAWVGTPDSRPRRHWPLSWGPNWFRGAGARTGPRGT